MEQAVHPIKATMVSLARSEREEALTKYFGPNSYHAASTSLFGVLHEVCPRHSGSLWHMYELSNGGFFIAPETGKQVNVMARPGESVELGAEAAGIAVCLIGYAKLAESNPAFPRLRDLLWQYACEHPEHDKINLAVSA